MNDRSPPNTRNVVVAFRQKGMSPDRPASLQLEHLFRENEQRLVRFLALRLGSETEARDAAQATFLRLWQRGDGLHDDNLVSLLFVTARNIATDMLRVRSRQQALTAADADGHGVSDDAPSAERRLAARQDLELIHGILDELPEKCRRAFVHYKFEGLSYADIAGRLGVTESMVRKHVSRAIAYCVVRFHELEGWA